MPNKEVQTDYLSIEPRYRNYNEIDEPIGYVARNMFVVTLSDPAKVEGLISDLLVVGVNHVNGVEFQTTEFKRHRESARELALKAAREKAEKMAAVLGCSVGEPLAISESFNGGSWYFSSWSGWGYGRSRGNVAERDPGHARIGRRRAPRHGLGQDFDPCRRIRDVCAKACSRRIGESLTAQRMLSMGGWSASAPQPHEITICKMGYAAVEKSLRR